MTSPCSLLLGCCGFLLTTKDKHSQQSSNCWGLSTFLSVFQQRYYWCYCITLSNWAGNSLGGKMKRGWLYFIEFRKNLCSLLCSQVNPHVAECHPWVRKGLPLLNHSLYTQSSQDSSHSDLYIFQEGKKSLLKFFLRAWDRLPWTGWGTKLTIDSSGRSSNSSTCSSLSSLSHSSVSHRVPFKKLIHTSLNFYLKLSVSKVQW